MSPALCKPLAIGKLGPHQRRSQIRFAQELNAALDDCFYWFPLTLRRIIQQMREISGWLGDNRYILRSASSLLRISITVISHVNRDVVTHQGIVWMCNRLPPYIHVFYGDDGTSKGGCVQVPYVFLLLMLSVYSQTTNYTFAIRGLFNSNHETITLWSLICT